MKRLMVMLLALTVALTLGAFPVCHHRLNTDPLSPVEF